MQGKMRGYGITRQFEDFGPIEADIPQIGHLDALAEPVVLAACTSDPHQVHAGLPEGLILGHEVVARIVEVGDEVKTYRPGDIVAVSCTTPDYLTLEVQDSITQHTGGRAGASTGARSRTGRSPNTFASVRSISTRPRSPRA